MIPQEPAALIADIEAQGRRIETPCGDGVVVWRAWGELGAPAIVLLHGGQGGWTHFIRNVLPLSRTFQVFAPDMPGYGASAMPPHPDAPEGYAEPLALGLQTLVDGPVDLVGFSAGAIIASHLAALQPDLVRRLIIVDAGGLETRVVAPDFVRMRGLEGEAFRAAQVHNLLALMIHAPEAADELALHVQAVNARAARGRAEMFVMPDGLVKVLPRVRAQVDLIWATEDLPHPDPEVQLAAVHRFCPDAELRIVPRAGHWVMYENAEAFNAALCELLISPLRDAVKHRS